MLRRPDKWASIWTRVTHLITPYRDGSPVAMNLPETDLRPMKMTCIPGDAIITALRFRSWWPPSQSLHRCPRPRPSRSSLLSISRSLHSPCSDRRGRAGACQSLLSYYQALTRYCISRLSDQSKGTIASSSSKKGGKTAKKVVKTPKVLVPARYVPCSLITLSVRLPVDRFS